MLANTRYPSSIALHTAWTCIRHLRDFLSAPLECSLSYNALQPLEHSSFDHTHPSAQDGGGVYVWGRATVISSIISHNQANDEGGGIYASGTLLLIQSFLHSNTAESTNGYAIFLTAAANATIRSCNITAGTVIGSYADDDSLVASGGALIDWGDCAPGWTPGDPGTSVSMGEAVSASLSCPFKCPATTYGPGGPSALLRNHTEGCEVGCITCPEGAICPHDGLEEPIWCTPGHFMGFRRSADQDCRKCSPGTYQPEHNATLSQSAISRF